ncbi:MAG: RdgB/HAM1 family non-canonical purine NTP pyrophosphatase [Bacteroidales bacterium]|uniref:RdgB/HAM1 family non-canonical purine NTP pyrophosphatase n=1 Tax=Porphyromonas sp. TaxID=1924944 RepID=UPI00297491E0|nr:RdgB/HAM1 family non-canonical purine NTP pyrophosphatase [Porphyromonas sp.]MDD7438565.1 RdgB/HAM1 family non-canonical purine NTP pyrophosphatase [Bacteroidales bacterium]MDY3066870.1 RdgB/HAM1 family non-canonical purine NTP pyrophosphatase [Porphyromonas sp.]
MKLLLATHNDHKTQEIRDILLASGLSIELHSLRDLGDMEEIPETGNTLAENAYQKAKTGYERHGINCFADDTGLEVEALGGAPGVYSARFAGPQCSSKDNIERLLGELEGVANRRARFRTVISLIMGGKEYQFDGEVRGEIVKELRGQEGFGYDPIFLPEKSDLTFAEMSEEDKNRISHRGKAIQKLIEFLENNR